MAKSAEAAHPTPAGLTWPRPPTPPRSKPDSASSIAPHFLATSGAGRTPGPSPNDAFRSLILSARSTNTRRRAESCPNMGVASPPMRILVTGSSGLLARHLMPRLRSAGHEVVRLLRPEGSSVVDFAAIRPDLDSLNPQPDLDRFDAVINLAGSNIGRRWTKKVREEVVRSRAEYTTKLCQALA